MRAVPPNALLCHAGPRRSIWRLDATRRWQQQMVELSRYAAK